MRGHIVAFDLAPPLLRHVVCSPRGYLVPRADGRLLAGSTAERAGFDKSVTAGALQRVLDDRAGDRAPLAEVAIAQTLGGPAAGHAGRAPDHRSRSGCPGSIHAAGLFRNGILLGPLVGEAVARLALGQDPGLDLSAFSPARF